MIITTIICITFVICFIISSRIYYNLKINKEFTIKSSNIISIINEFKNTYVDGYYRNDGIDSKYIGKGKDLCCLFTTIERILNNKIK